MYLTFKSAFGSIVAGISIENVSSPVRPKESTDSPLKVNGKIPIPTKLLRWIRSKDCAKTAFIPNKRAPFAAQSRDEPVPYSLPAKTIRSRPSFGKP